MNFAIFLVLLGLGLLVYAVFGRRPLPPASPRKAPTLRVVTSVAWNAAHPPSQRTSPPPPPRHDAIRPSQRAWK